MELVTFTPAQHLFLSAMAKGKHRKGEGSRLRQLVAKREKAMYGRLQCFCCLGDLTHAQATLEHIIPRARQGKTVLSNLALSHSACNLKRGDSGDARGCLSTNVVVQ